MQFDTTNVLQSPAFWVGVFTVTALAGMFCTSSTPEPVPKKKNKKNKKAKEETKDA